MRERCWQDEGESRFSAVSDCRSHDFETRRTRRKKIEMNVLIIADDAEFSRSVVGRWQTERNVPEFAVVNRSVWRESGGGEAENAAFAAASGGVEYDLAILEPMPASEITSLLNKLEPASVPVVCVVTDTGLAQSLRNQSSRVLVLRQYEGWLDALALVAGEALRRMEAQTRAKRAEEAAALANRQAMLGRYMLEMRHSLNNALTSVLGHSELLLLEPGVLSAEIRDQIDTIHCMSMRMHEILQRFSSLDAEMHFAERQSQHETRPRAQAFGAGSQ